MPDLKIDWWLSVFLAIPLAIVGNLLTTRVQKWLDKRAETRDERLSHAAKKRSLKLFRRTLKEHSLDLRAAQGPNGLVSMYLEALLRVALYAAFGSSYAALFFLYGEGTILDGAAADFEWINRMGREVVTSTLRMLAQATTLVVGLLIYRECHHAIKRGRRLKQVTVTEALLADLAYELGRVEELHAVLNGMPPSVAKELCNPLPRD